ncbi:MAG: aminotransferase class IV [Acidimicrobiales bacterium]
MSALDHGLTVGDGVFETLKVVDGTPFAMTRHLARLRRSAEVLDLRVPMDDAELRAAGAELIDASRARRAEAGRLRITVTGGRGPLGSGRDHVEPTILLATSEARPWPATASVLTVPWVRNERSAVAGAKTTSYADNVVALAAAHAAGADEAIFANTVGALCEGTGTNVFVVSGSRVRTPALSSGCLAGVTRELLLEVIECEETDELTLDQLRGADEAFLTSSTRDVQAIATVDGVAIGPAAPGPHTAAAAVAFAAVQARSLDP